jgi:nitroreductase
MSTTAAFEIIEKVIQERRTVKAPMMNGRVIEEDTLERLIALAHYAPTHGRTEPWHFNIYTGASLKHFCEQHGELYWEHSPEASRIPGTKQNLTNMGDKASHLVIVTMRRTPETKIPFLEEYAATAAATQNILLGAEALGIAAIWSTGGMALKPVMKTFLHLKEDDEVVGFLYLGYTDQEKKPAQRNSTIAAKITRP